MKTELVRRAEKGGKEKGGIKNMSSLALYIQKLQQGADSFDPNISFAKQTDV